MQAKQAQGKQAQTDEAQTDQAQGKQAQTEQAQTEQAQADQEQILLPYHTLKKDISNKMYTDCVKKLFQNLPNAIKEEFEKATMNLMQEDYISPNLLIDAANHFYKIHTQMCDNSYHWAVFSNYILNYRPQPL